MSWELQRQEVSGGDVATLQFSGAIGVVFYGISRFSIIVYYGGATDISGLGISLERENSDSPSKLRLRANVSISPLGEATVTVVAIAWIGTSSSSITVIEGKGLPTAAMSEPVAVGPCPMTMLAALRGFDLAFNDGDNSVTGVGAAAGVNASIWQRGWAYVTAAATLTGNGASTCTTDATALVLASAQDGIWFGTVDDDNPINVDSENTHQLVVTTGAAVPLADAVVLLQSFFIRFATNESLQRIYMGASKAEPSPEAPGQFSFDSTRWMLSVLTETQDLPPAACTASYVWAAIGKS